MKNLTIILCLFLLFVGSDTLADELPALMLKEGANEIEITVLNNLPDILVGIMVEADEENLPEWLEVEVATETLDLHQGQKSSGKFILNLIVKDAPLDATAQFPFTFKDNKGKEWNYSVIVKVNDEMPTGYVLYENFPNPFNPTTTISYTLKENTKTKLIVYNSMGQKIRTLKDSPQNAGKHSVQWDGKDDHGNPMSSGLYIYTLHAGNFTKTMKMLLVQ